MQASVAALHSANTLMQELHLLQQQQQQPPPQLVSLGQHDFAQQQHLLLLTPEPCRERPPLGQAAWLFSMANRPVVSAGEAQEACSAERIPDAAATAPQHAPPGPWQ
jgi:hypothetical protein